MGSGLSELEALPPLPNPEETRVLKGVADAGGAAPPPEGGELAAPDSPPKSTVEGGVNESKVADLQGRLDSQTGGRGPDLDIEVGGDDTS